MPDPLPPSTQTSASLEAGELPPQTNTVKVHESGGDTITLSENPPVIHSNAVINADSAKGGDIVTANLKKHVRQLIDGIKQGAQPPSGQQKLLDKLTNALKLVVKHADTFEEKRTKIAEEMRELEAEAADSSDTLDTQDTQDTAAEKSRNLANRKRTLEAEYGTVIAADFGKAGEIAESLGNELKKAARDENSLNPLAKSYKDVAVLLQQVSAMHQTAAAPFRMGNYVETQLRNVEKNAPGYFKGTSGSIYFGTTGASLGLDQITHGFGLTYQSQFFLLSDEDTDPNTWAPQALAFNFDLGNPALAALSVGLRVEGSGVFRAANTVEEVIANEAMDKANSESRWNPLVPGGIRVRHGIDYVRDMAKRGLGETLTASAPFPYVLSERNVGKGADNTLMRLAAEHVDSHGALHVKMTDIVDQGYPAIAKRLEQNKFKTIQKPDNKYDHLRFDTFNPMASTAGSTYAVQRRSQRFANKSLSLGIEGKFLDSAKLKGDATRLSYEMEFTSFSHEAMDLGYRRYMGQLFAMDHYIEAADARLTGGNPRYHLYHSIDDAVRPWALQGHYKPEDMEDGKPLPGAVKTIWQPAKLDRKLSQQEHEFFGPKSAIPTKFQNVIAGYTLYALNAVKEQFEALEDRAKTLIASQGALFEEPPANLKPTDKLLKDFEAKRMAAFDAINDDIWGATPDKPGSGYPGGAAKALKNYEATVKFYARSHDAISLALGNAGTYFSVMWHQIQSNDGQPDMTVCGATAGEELEKTSESYQSCRELLEKGTHVLRKETLTKYSTFVEKGIWMRDTAAVSAGVGGGSIFDIITTLIGKGDTAPVTIPNEFGQVGLELGLRIHNAGTQVTPIREARYMDLHGTIKANGALGEALYKGVEMLMKRAYRGTENTQQIKLTRTLENTLRSIVQEQSSGAGILVRMRNNPDGSGLDLHMQYARVYKHTDTGMTVKKKFPTTIGNIKASIGRSEAKRTVVMEVLGSDPTYNMLQFPRLSKHLENAMQLVEKRMSKQKTAFLQTMSSQVSKGSPQSNSQLDLPSKGIRIVPLEMDSASTDPAGKENEKVRRTQLREEIAKSILADQHVLNQFFGGTAIADTVGMFEQYTRDLEKYGRDALATLPGRNEYHRLYGEAPFKNPTDVAHIGKHFAPGAIALETSTPASEVLGLLTSEKGFEFKATFMDENGKTREYKSWDEVMARVDKLKTAKERLEFYTKEDLGIEIFQAYIDIMNNTREINKAAFPQLGGSKVGLVAKLRDQTDRRAGNAALKSVRGNANAAGDAPTPPAKGNDGKKAEGQFTNFEGVNEQVVEAGSSKPDSRRSSVSSNSDLPTPSVLFKAGSPTSSTPLKPDSGRSSVAPNTESPKPLSEKSVSRRSSLNKQDSIEGGSRTSNDNAQVNVENSRDSMRALDESTASKLEQMETDTPIDTAAVLEDVRASLDEEERPQQQN